MKPTCAPAMSFFSTVLLASGLTSLAPPAQAADFSWSGYGALGYSRSNRAYSYDRFVSDQGTLNRDSILGLQLHVDVTPQWSATLQATIAPSASEDNKTEATLPWAYVSWRASNDLLIRAGKMRMPMYLYSENMNVGASYDFMHLPTEVYSTAPTNDFIGLSFARTWALSAGEFGLDGYWGYTRLPINMSSLGTEQFADLRTRSGGLMLSMRRDDDIYRVGMQQAYIQVPTGGVAQLPGGVVSTPSIGDTMSGSGPVAGGNQGDIDTQVYLFGAEIALDSHTRLIGEVARRHAQNLITPKNSVGAYVSVLKKIGPWVPYITLARLLSDAETRHSDDGDHDDQSSTAVGVSFVVSPGSRVKAEWMRVHVRGASTLVRNVSGQIVRNQDINVLSVAYTFTF